jgi:hypothetical protein
MQSGLEEFNWKAVIAAILIGVLIAAVLYFFLH